MKNSEDYFPQPCVKKVDVDSAGEVEILRQLEYIRDELVEAKNALCMKEKLHAAEELTDVIVAATTCLEMMGHGFADRVKLVQMVNIKNRARGYY